MFRFKTRRDHIIELIDYCKRNAIDNDRAYHLTGKDSDSDLSHDWWNKVDVCRSLLEKEKENGMD